MKVASVRQVPYRAACAGRRGTWRQRALGGEPAPGRIAAGAAFAVASVGTNLSNIAFHLVIGPALGPVRYGALGAVLAVLAGVTVPAMTLQTLVTARVARRIDEGAGVDTAPAMRRCTAIGAVGAALLLAATPALAGFAHLASPWPLVLLAACCVPLAAGVVPAGILCAHRRFATVGVTTLAAALLRVVLALVLVRLGTGVAGAVGASLCVEWARTGVLWWLARRGAPCPPGAPQLRIDLRQAAGGVGAMAAVEVLLGLDTLLARHYLPAYQAGLYVAATTAARAVFFGSQIACTLGLPGFASRDERRGRRARLSTVVATAALGVAATGALAGLGPVLLRYAFGAAFRFSPELLAVRGLAATVLSLLSLAVQYRLARGTHAGAWAAWWGVAAVLTLCALYHRDAVSLSVAATAGMTVAALPLAAVRRRVVRIAHVR